MGEKWPKKFRLKPRLPRNAANLRHGTAPSPKEGVLRIFFLPEKSDGFGRVLTRDLGYQRPAR
jgi:hypothetical protein